MPTITCSCGRPVAVPRKGGKVRCPSCNAVLAVPAPMAESDAEQPAAPRSRRPFLIRAAFCVAGLVLVAAVLFWLTPRRPSAATNRQPAASREAKTRSDPDKLNDLLRKAIAAAQAQRWGQVFEFADEALEIDPGNADALFLRGSTNSMIAISRNPPDMERWAKGLEDMRRAAEKDPGRKETYEVFRKRYKTTAALLGAN